MKVLHIAPTPFFADRGCHIRILGEIQTLQVQGHDILLTTYHIGRDIDGVNISRIIDVPWCRKLDVGFSWHKFYLDILLLMTTMRVCFLEKPDIIHGHLHEGAVIGKLVSFLSSMGKVPVIFDVQGSLTEELDTYGVFKKFKAFKSIFKVIEKMICRLPDYFVCSSYSNDEFIKYKMNVPEEKVATVLDGIYPDFFSGDRSQTLREKLNISPNRKIVIYTGSLIKSKGIDYLLDAIPEIVGKFSQVFFLIVGYPVEQCKKKCENMGIEEFVMFTGRVEYFHLPEYLSLAHVAVDPKVDKAGEGSGKIMNYMGAGLPVVCFDGINTQLFLGDNGVYAKPGSSEDLADKIVSVLKDKALAKRIGSLNAKRIQKHYSLPAIGKKLSDIYMNVTNKQQYHNS